MTGPLHVLLVEDSDSDAKLVTLALRGIGRELIIERVEDPGAMSDALARSTFDVVISDWSMPRFSAPQALALVRATQLDLPFIIVSGTIGEEIAVDAMRAGAHDYVLKGNLARLAPAVERELREHTSRRARRSADEALRLSEARFRALIERSDEGITLADRDGTLLYASPGARRILGIGEDALGAKGFVPVHVDDRGRASEISARLRAAPGTSETAELRIVRADGATRWIEFTLVNRLEEPAVSAVVANFRDVTERKKSLDDLRESETRFRRLWDSGLIGISITDQVGAYHEANDALLAIIGYTRTDLEAGHVGWAEMTPSEWRSTNVVAGEQLRVQGTAGPWEKQYARKDGSRAPVLVALATLPRGRVISLVVDLTELKKAEKALQGSEAQLRQAQKMEAIGRLAGGVAHDFNNLLSIILSYGELALGDLKPDDPLRDDLLEICKAGKRAADLTSQLLMFSRQQVLEPMVLDLNDALAGMSKMLRRMLGEDVDLTFVAAAPLGRVKVDPSSMEQVVMNLVVNARDAMPTGGQLTVETADFALDEEFCKAHVGVSPGPYVMLAVTDTGTGMDRETQARIFEPFFTTKGTGKGTGLGLSTVFGIVQQSGGTIWVYSEPGRGTTFKVYLPRVGEPVTPQRAAPVGIELRGTETILLVEDEDAVRTVARSILARAGYEVLEARNGGEALQHADSHAGPIHLLLTDVVMPHMSGPTLANLLTRDRPDMKVLCMSGYTDDSVVRHGVIESEIAYLQKPLTPDSLKQKVREVLDAARRAASGHE